MKKVLYLFFFCNIYFLVLQPAALPTASYQDAAHDWAQDVIKHSSLEHAYALLDLTYISYMRSYMTLKAQREYLELLERVGSGWNHILNTRLDPSKDEEFDVDSLSHDLLCTHVYAFHKTCELHKKYVDIIEKMVTDEEKQFIACKTFIDDLRKRARAAIVESLTIFIEDIEKELTQAHEALVEAADFFKQNSHIKSLPGIRSVTELLWHYVPALMIKAFINFDRGYRKGSQGCLQAYLNSQRVSNSVWKAVEVPRAGYYAAHYQELFTLLEKAGRSTKHYVHPDELLNNLTTTIISYTPR